MMKDISTLISLNDGETILGIFEDEREEQMGAKYLNKKYHTLEDLPKIFFTVTPEFISYKFTHVFTNKRYIAIGVNFWQLYDLYCMERREKIDISNFTLCIQREELQSVKITFGFSNNTIFLSNLVELECFTDKRYKLIKSFLIEKWNLASSEIEKEENQRCLSFRKIMRVKNAIQYVMIFFPLYVFSQRYYNNTDNLVVNLIFIALFSLNAFLSVVETLYLYIPHKKNRLLISITFRVSLIALPILIFIELINSFIFL